MGAISLDQARSGMVLEHDVVVRVLEAGVTLTPAHLTLLRSWGVRQLAVRDTPEAGSGSPPDGVEAEVADRFRTVEPGHPAIEELRRLVVARRRREIEGARGHAR